MKTKELGERVRDFFAPYVTESADTLDDLAVEAADRLLSQRKEIKRLRKALKAIHSEVIWHNLDDSRNDKHEHYCGLYYVDEDSVQYDREDGVCDCAYGAIRTILKKASA